MKESDIVKLFSELPQVRSAGVARVGGRGSCVHNSVLVSSRRVLSLPFFQLGIFSGSSLDTRTCTCSLHLDILYFLVLDLLGRLGSLLHCKIYTTRGLSIGQRAACCLEQALAMDGMPLAEASERVDKMWQEVCSVVGE